MPFLIPFLISSLVGGFAVSIVQGLIKAAISIGIGFIVYQGIDALLSNTMINVVNNFGQSTIVGILQLMKVDRCLNVLASAVAVKYSLRVGTGALKKMVLK